MGMRKYAKFGDVWTKGDVITERGPETLMYTDVVLCYHG